MLAHNITTTVGRTSVIFTTIIAFSAHVLNSHSRSSRSKSWEFSCCFLLLLLQYVRNLCYSSLVIPCELFLCAFVRMSQHPQLKSRTSRTQIASDKPQNFYQQIQRGKASNIAG